LVAMSGGVDSSVAAALLKQAGYQPIGIFMCLGQAGYGTDGDSSGCCSPQDAADARVVADKLGIEMYVLNLGSEFKSIIDYFVAEYSVARTPNPCILCNSRIKFGKLLRHADSLGIRCIATGHYARTAEFGGSRAIFRNGTRAKDQSYVLFGIGRQELDRLRFPLGELANKDQVRKIAKDLGLKVHDKPDSQEVCFVPDNDAAAFLRMKAPALFKQGRFIDSNGKTLGYHDGFARFTIGQRRGLGVAAGERLFVTKIDPDTNTVTLGPRDRIYGNQLDASDANWHCDVPERFEAIVQIRYNHEGVPATVTLTGNGNFHVEFKERVSAITPGQAAVCYDGDRLLGGGWIVGGGAGRN
jgi:tRNA-specific 2-thiouridylase